MRDMIHARHRMVEVHIARRGIDDPRVLEAMRTVPRENFVAPGSKDYAYEDGPLPIGHGQTISQPFIVALMIDKARIDPGEKVLEVGTGSGYAAAVMSRIAGHVYTVERHQALGSIAASRFTKLGYGNIDVRIGDGTRGWPEHAPFDAILVAAGGPFAPQALKDQLAIGGRLIMPIGRDHDQRLVRITRRSAATFEEEDLGGVVFVPLIGAQGWPEDGSLPVESDEDPSTLARMIADVAEPLPDIDDPGFARLFDRFADSRIVLLGEATHGTSEFYRARAAITRRLIEVHGFTIVAVEADWPDAASLDRYVRLRPDGAGADPPFRRFPTWMWRNVEVSGFLDGMRRHNEGVKNPDRQAGFYGLDIYNMSASIAAVIAYLGEVDPEAAAVARERYGCLSPWQHEPSDYGRAVLSSGYQKCEAAVVEQCRDLLQRSLEAGGDEGLLDAAQNARLVASAERYYRIMYQGGAAAWNLRDTHMFETLEHLLEAKGPQSKTVVWAHNSHIGDARHTDMGRLNDELNLGQLCRERFGDETALIGFGTHTGTVAAANDWDGEMEIKAVRPSHPESHEHVFHEAAALADMPRYLVDFQQAEALRHAMAEPKLERFIGVIYRPETERLSHYVHASLPQQFDAFLWFDETSAVTPLAAEQPGANDVPETFPFGL